MKKHQKLLRDKCLECLGLEKNAEGITRLKKKLSGMDGYTTTQKMANLLQKENVEDKGKVNLIGFFCGSFTKSNKVFWRIIQSGDTKMIDMTENNSIKKAEFGDHIKLTNVHMTYKKITQREYYQATPSSTLEEITEGSIIETAEDLTVATPNHWGLFSGTLFKANKIRLNKDPESNEMKPIVDDSGFNLRLTLMGQETDMDDKSRFVSTFVNSQDQLISLFPKDNQDFVKKQLLSDDSKKADRIIMDQLASISMNPDIGIPGAALIIYGELREKAGNDRTFFNVSLRHVLNIDNLKGEELWDFDPDADLESSDSDWLEEGEEEEIDSDDSDDAIDLPVNDQDSDPAEASDDLIFDYIRNNEGESIQEIVDGISSKTDAIKQDVTESLSKLIRSNKLINDRKTLKINEEEL